MEQSREIVAIEKGAFWSPSTTVTNCCSPDIGLAVRVFANGPGDLGSIPGRVIPKTQKMVLDASLLNTQHYKVLIKGKVEQSREEVVPSPTSWCSSYWKGALGLPSTMVANFTYLCYQIHNIKEKKILCRFIISKLTTFVLFKFKS